MIRDLRWDDMGDLIENYYSYYDEVNKDPDFGIIFYRDKPDYESEMSWFYGLITEVLRGDAVAQIAEVDGKIVGMCDVHRLRPGSEISHVGVLGIAIKEGFRDKGIGRELMVRTLEKCRGKFEIIRLDVFTTNKRAIALYKKLGFVEYGLFPAGVKRGNRYIDEYAMYYRL